MSRILVTGGSGFIGSHVAKHLLHAGHHVISVDDHSARLYNCPPSAIDLQTSITNAMGINSIFAQHQPEYVIHCAAYAAEGLSHFIRHFNYSNNVLGSVNLINAAVNHRVKCFVFLSSIAVYGDAQPPFIEDDLTDPIDPYGIAKLSIEMDLRAAHAMFGLPYVIFRPHNVYGEGQNLADNYRNVIGIFMRQCIKGEARTIFGDGSQVRAFSYIDDVAPAIAASIDRPNCWNAVYNAGSDDTYSVSELAEKVSAAMAVPHHVVHLPERAEAKEAYCMHTKFHRAFDDIAINTPMEAGLRRMAGWAKLQPTQQTQVFDSIEVTKNLPPSWAALSKLK